MMKKQSNAAAVAILVMGSAAHAYDVNDKLSISGVLAGAGQCQSVSDTDADNVCRGAVPLQVETSFRPGEAHELFFKLGFTAGNGLNKVSPFVLAPWSADLEDDVKDINGRNRDYLLAAWYKHSARFQEDHRLAVAFGILDPQEYLNDNRYAEDEYSQFMNEAFSSTRGYDLPIYDYGVALEWAYGDWSVRAIGMNVGKNEDGNNFNVWGAQVGYHLKSSLGSGNYRIILIGTNAQFLNPEGTDKKSQSGFGLSFDQQLGGPFGGFLRFGWRKTDAAVDHANFYSGGLDISGGAWGRADDNIGVGYGYLNGGNTGVNRTHVFETYYRFVLNDYFALTGDVQYMKDESRNSARSNDPEGWIFGLRAAVEF